MLWFTFGKSTKKYVFRELTWRTSCLKGAGSTQLMRRSSRSIMAEASMCFSTRPIKPSFFFRKVITWKTKLGTQYFWFQRVDWSRVSVWYLTTLVSKIPNLCLAMYVTFIYTVTLVKSSIHCLCACSTQEIVGQQWSFSEYLFGFPGNQIANGFAEEAGQ